MTPLDVDRAHDRWLRQSRNVESLVRTLAHVERNAIESVARAKRTLDAEGVRVEEREQAHQVRSYEGAVLAAIKIRNAVEAEVFGRAAPPSARRSAPAAKT